MVSPQLSMREVEGVIGEGEVGACGKVGEGVVEAEAVGGGVVVAAAGVRAAGVVPFAGAGAGLLGGTNRWMAIVRLICRSNLAVTTAEGASWIENHLMKRALAFDPSARLVGQLVVEMSSRTDPASVPPHPPYPSRMNVDHP